MGFAVFESTVIIKRAGMGISLSFITKVGLATVALVHGWLAGEWCCIYEDCADQDYVKYNVEVSSSVGRKFLPLHHTSLRFTVTISNFQCNLVEVARIIDYNRVELHL